MIRTIRLRLAFDRREIRDPTRRQKQGQQPIANGTFNQEISARCIGDATVINQAYHLRYHPGEVVLATDHAGSGHKWRLVNDEPWKRAYVAFKKGANTRFIPDKTK